MKEHDPKRRQFLRVLISLPTGFVIGWDLERHKSTVHAGPLNPEESLKKLILLLGPWPFTDREKAEDFARRFLKAKHAVGSYLPGSSKLVQSLAGRFPADTVAIREINLQNLPTKERELLMNLVKQLYSFIEVRFYVSDEPPWGECQDDTTRHTRAPTLRKI